MPRTTPHVNPEIHVPRPMIFLVSSRSISGMQPQRFLVFLSVVQTQINMTIPTECIWKMTWTWTWIKPADTWGDSRILTLKDPGSPKLRMVSWNLNFPTRLGGDWTPQSHPLTFGDWIPRLSEGQKIRPDSWHLPVFSPAGNLNDDVEMFRPCKFLGLSTVWRNVTLNLRCLEFLVRRAGTRHFCEKDSEEILNFSWPGDQKFW